MAEMTFEEMIKLRHDEIIGSMRSALKYAEQYRETVYSVMLDEENGHPFVVDMSLAEDLKTDGILLETFQLGKYEKPAEWSDEDLDTVLNKAAYEVRRNMGEYANFKNVGEVLDKPSFITEEINADLAVGMAEANFHVFIDDTDEQLTKEMMLDHNNPFDYEKHTFSAPMTEVEQYNAVEALCEKLDDLNDDVRSDVGVYLKEYADELFNDEDSENQFRWVDIRSEWQNIRDSILSEKTEYIRYFLNDIPDDYRARAANLLEDLDDYEKSYLNGEQDKTVDLTKHNDYTQTDEIEYGGEWQDGYAQADDIEYGGEWQDGYAQADEIEYGGEWQETKDVETVPANELDPSMDIFDLDNSITLEAQPSIIEEITDDVSEMVSDNIFYKADDLGDEHTEDSFSLAVDQQEKIRELEQKLANLQKMLDKTNAVIKSDKKLLSEFKTALKNFNNKAEKEKLTDISKKPKPQKHGGR